MNYFVAGYFFDQQSEPTFRYRLTVPKKCKFDVKYNEPGIDEGRNKKPVGIRRGVQNFIVFKGKGNSRQGPREQGIFSRTD